MAGTRVAIGDKFGLLTIIGDGGHYESPGGASLKLWHCQCSCAAKGTTKTTAQRLKSGHTTSCGCVKAAALGNATRKHGEAGRAESVEYVAWCRMLSRCDDQKNSYYESYGGRGIQVCDRWRGEDGYANFLADMGRRPSKAHSLDREKINGNYEPGNCRWATSFEQSRNTRRNVFVEYRGERLVVKDWANRTGLNSQTILDRLRRGWTDAQAIGMDDHPRAFTTGVPVGTKRSLRIKRLERSC